jgi:hypothetical protein
MCTSMYWPSRSQIDMRYLSHTCSLASYHVQYITYSISLTVYHVQYITYSISLTVYHLQYITYTISLTVYHDSADTLTWIYYEHEEQSVLAFQNKYLSTLPPPQIVGRDSSVGIVTRYELDGPRIESRWGRGFPHPPDRPWGLPSLLYNGYRVFPGGKAAGAWR